MESDEMSMKFDFGVKAVERTTLILLESGYLTRGNNRCFTQ